MKSDLDKFRSPTGWWIGSLVFKKSNPNDSKCWINTYLIEENAIEGAFSKLEKIGREEEESFSQAFSYSSKFIGICELMPVYEDLRDKAEILWQELDESEGKDVELLSLDDLRNAFTTK